MATNAKQDRGFIGLRDLVDAGSLATKRQETESLRNVLKRDWALNREYYNGNQWSFWNAAALRVESMPVDQGPAWRVRLQDNQIKPGIASYVAQLTKTRPVITATPDSAGDTDVKAAQMATSLYEYLFESMHLNQKVGAALHEASLSGGFWNITWDALAGKPMTFTIGPDGNPIMDDELAEVFLDQLEQQAEQAGHPVDQVMAMAKKTVYLGDIKINVMTAENVLLDPAADEFDDAKWAICRHSLDPDEIEARWGVKVQPNATKASDTRMNFARDIEEKRPTGTVREVFVMYIRPHPALPKGRYVVWIEGPNEILQDIEWPYPFRELPLVKFPGTYRPDSPYDDPVTTQVRPLQKDLNKTLSQVVEHKNLTVRPQMLAPIGSLRGKMTTEPGAVFEFNPVGQHVPQWREIPNLPGYVFEHLADIQNRIDKKYNRIPSSRDQIPARADGGALLEGMQEATSDQISFVILGLEDALARAGHLIAAYAQKYYEEPRLIRIRGTGGGVQVKKFEQADIAGSFTFQPSYGTGLPRTRQGRQDAILALVDAKLIDPNTAMKHLDLGDLRGVQAQLAANEDQAYREHDKMLRGIPINQPALDQAQQALQQFQQGAKQQMAQMMEEGMEQAGQQQAQTGGPPEDPAEVQQEVQQQVMQQMQQQFQQLQQAVQDAPWQPLDYEDWQSHITTHSDLMKTAEFERYDPKVQAIFIQHYNLTYQRWMQIRMSMPDEQATPKINVRAMGTVSAPVMTALLKKGGINIEEADVAAPPLDTVVVDTLEQPNVEGSGNSQADQLGMMQAQDKHELAQAQTAAAIAAADAKHAAATGKTVQAMGQAEQTAQNSNDTHTLQLAAQKQALDHAQAKHEQAMRHAEEKHAAAKKAASQKPAPKQGK